MQKTGSAALLVIGNEILSGRTQDANIKHIALRLMERGVALVEVRVVPDIEAKIIKAVNELRAEVDYVFTTGGIGPTHDDITAASIAKAFGTKLHAHPGARRVMEEHYGTTDLSETRLRMAMIPDGAELIPNPVSGAPGFIIGNVHVMAGVPKIMQAMLENILPLLKQGAVILSKTVSCNLRESEIAEQLAALQDRHKDVDIGSYPHYPGLNLVLRSIDQARLGQAANELMEIIRGLGDKPLLS